MKKFLTFLCTIACVFSLTACGEAKTVSDYQQDKIENAKLNVTYNFLPMMESFMGNADSVLDEYTAEEIEAFLVDDSGKSLVDGNGFKSSVISFNSSADTVGEILDTGEVTAKVDGDNIIVNVEIKGSKKDADAEFVVSNDIFMVMKSAALNPRATMGDKMVKAALNTLIGMSTVFIVLILISLLISLLKYVPAMVDSVAAMFTKKNNEEEKKESLDNTIQQIVEKEENNSNLASDLELVAVISAAIAAYEGEAGADGFVVRSIRKKY